MKILIINHYVGSNKFGMDYRQYYLAKEWVNQHHEVTILGADYSHLRINQPKVSRDLATEGIHGIKYIWIKTPKYRLSGIRRIINMLTFIMKLVYYYKKIAKRVSPDAVIAASTYVLDIYPAYLIAKRSNAKLVYELHDMWPLTPVIIGGYSKYHPFIWFIKKAENFACRNSNCYISFLRNAKDYLIQHGLKEEKFVYVPNGYSEDQLFSDPIPIPEEHKELLQRLKKEARIIVGYAGGHAWSNALGSLILASKLFSNNHHLAFVLVGNGSRKTELMRMANQQSQSNIFFLPPVSKAAIPTLLNECDILYAGGVSSILHSFGTSFNKVTDYMLAGKPIIFAVDELNSLVERVGCGLQVPAENVDEIAKAIEFLYNLSSAERKDMGIKGKEYAVKELPFSTIAHKIVQAIHDC